MEDIREELFKGISAARVTACIFADGEGLLCVAGDAVETAEELGLTVDYAAEDGTRVLKGDMLMQLSGTPIQMARAEDELMGCMLKPSGVATAAAAFVHAAGGELRVVCGSWKKLPAELRPRLRRAVALGGVAARITDGPMVYLDKNIVEMLGGIQKSLGAAESVEGRKKVVQIRARSENGNIVREAWAAISSGADIVFVDTGHIEDAALVAREVKPVLSEWEREYGYRKVEIAYAGGVTLEDVRTLRGSGVDIVGVGRAIIDAPMLDMHMDVIKVERGPCGHGYDLLDKSELLIEGIHLSSGNLNRISDAVAEEIGIDPQDVLVIDVRDGTVALDVLRREVDPRGFIGRERAILTRLAAMEGVELEESAHISSRGMLGWIAGDSESDAMMRRELEKAEANVGRVRERIARRAIVFPSGAEVEDGEIEDTNTPMLLKMLRESGFEADRGEILKDDIDLFTGKLRRACDMGYGLIITTGGVGAEDKDHSVEAIERLDRTAAAPYIAKFTAGEGRHRKDGIRIGVGKVGPVLLVALPGPNDEVALCAGTVIEGAQNGWSKELIAAKLAGILRERLREKVGHCHRHHERAEQ